MNSDSMNKEFANKFADMIYTMELPVYVIMSRKQDGSDVMIECLITNEQVLEHMIKMMESYKTGRVYWYERHITNKTVKGEAFDSITTGNKRT